MTGFDAAGWNTVPIEDSDVEWGEHSATATLTRSRWEGTTFTHPVAMIERISPERLEFRFPANWDFAITDGRYSMRVDTREFFEDRTTPLDASGTPFVVPPAFPSRGWAFVEVPSANVIERGDRSFKMSLTRSRWEGLHITHPVTMLTESAEQVTLRFPRNWAFKVYGGDEVIAATAREFFDDRTFPLEAEGESLAVERKRWYRPVFHPSHLARKEKSVMVRFPWWSEHPEAVVFHPARLVSADGEMRFHEDWDFTLKTRDGEALSLDAASFDALTTGWREASASVERGIYRLEPAVLEPISEVVIPCDLELA